MSEVPPLAESLLSALREAGGNDEARAFERELAARSWQLTADDYVALTGAIQRAVLAPPNTPRETPPAVPLHLQGLAAFAPWVDVLPGRWQLVDAMDAVLRATTADELSSALVRVFVDLLGYEARAVDDLSRLGEQKTFTHLVSLAEHDGFHVVVAATRYAGRFTQCFDPVFRLRPYAIVFSIAGDMDLRVVARQRSTARGPRYPCRSLRGRGLFGSFDDDLLTWCRRAAMLQPRARDDQEELRSRAEQCVVASPAEVGTAWESGTVDPAELPGASWGGASAEAVRFFLQPESAPADRLMVGLQFELRAVMPWRSRGGVAVHFDRYEVVAPPEPLDTCVVRREDRVVQIRLYLVHERETEDAGVRRVPFSVDAVVHVPDDDGVYCIAGDAMHHVPGIVARTLLSEDESDAEALELDDAGADIDEAAEDDDATTTSSEVAPAEPEAAGISVRDDDVHRGPSELALLRLALAKRLRGIGYAASLVTAETLATPDSVRAWLSVRFGDRRGRLGLTAIGHLRRHLVRVAGRWRPVRIDVDGRLPAWACPEAAAVLPRGSAVPVAAARVGPGGVLSVPVTGADGRTKLVAAPEDAFTINPRFRDSTDDVATANAQWICERWSHRKEARAGELAEGTGVARSVHVKLRVAALHAEKSRFLLPAEKWPTVDVRRMWCVDLPVARESAVAPTIRLVRGQRIDPGDVIAIVDPQSWEPRARSERHEVATQAATLPRDDDDMDDDRCVVRCPPGLSGHVTRASSTVVRDSLGSTLCHRMMVETSRPVRPVGVRLRDGRRLAIHECAPSEMPYSLQDGATFDALLEDGADTSEWAPSVEEDWIDGRTGEVIEDLRALDTLEFEYPELPALPDPDLRYRVLDGGGLPRAQDDARITLGTLRWWRATDPDAAAQIDDAAALPHGWHPSATSLHDLAIASHVRTPPIVPSVWAESVERERMRTEHDPTRTNRGFRQTRHRDQQRYAPWAWSCRCGALRGEARAFERCQGCGERTEVRVLEGELPAIGAIELGTVVVHPWRKSIVAALLGLKPSELDQILAAHDGSALAEATQPALVEPERSLLTRLARSEDAKEREALSRGFEELATVHRLRFDDLWLAELCLLPTRMLPDALPMGSTDVLASPLTRHYRLVAAAAGLAARANAAGETLLRTLTGVRLQRAIDELFGDLDKPTTGTLAEMWRRIWPTTADAGIELVVPGLFRSYSADDLRSWPHVGVFGAPPAESGEELVELGILRDGEIIALPRDSRAVPAATSSAAYEERDAWRWLGDDALPALAAICLGVDVIPELRAQLGPTLPAVLEGSTDVGRVILRELLRLLEPPRGRPSVLRRLLAGTRIDVLPAERESAMLVVRERLQSAFGVRDPGADLVSHALSLVLTVFDKGPITDGCPTGWRALLGGESPTAGRRRCVPRLGDAAWAAWPGFLLLTDPVRCAAQARWNDPISSGHRAWLGLESSPLPPAWWSDDQVELVAAAVPSDPVAPMTSASPEALESIVVWDITEPVPVRAGEPDIEIRVLPTSVGEWIAEHTSRSHG